MTDDGLAMLEAQQQKARARAQTRSSARHLPPPKHGARPQKTPAPVAGPKQAEELQPQAAVEASPTSDTSPADELVRATIYLDGPNSDWLEEVHTAGRRGRPKVDASRSAVTRLALERLRGQLTAEEVVAQIKNRTDNADKRPGRKRG